MAISGNLIQWIAARLPHVGRSKSRRAAIVHGLRFNRDASLKELMFEGVSGISLLEDPRSEHQPTDLNLSRLVGFALPVS